MVRRLLYESSSNLSTLATLFFEETSDGFSARVETEGAPVQCFHATWLASIEKNISNENGGRWGQALNMELTKYVSVLTEDYKR